MKTLTDLTEEYYNLIGGDHHKDRDCHFYINKTYSYGDEPYYQFEHFGYCNTTESFFSDEKNALDFKDFIKQQEDFLADRKNTYLESEGEKYYLADANEELEICSFPKRKTEAEAENDMRLFLEWTIKEEQIEEFVNLIKEND